MDPKEIHSLLVRLESGTETEADRFAVEALLSSGELRIEDIAGNAHLLNLVNRLETPATSRALDRRFYDMLSTETANRKRISWKNLFAIPKAAPAFAMAGFMLIIGLALGYLFRPTGTDPGKGQIAALSQQVSELQEMMMLSLLEKGSATERLQAVHLTQEMSEASQQVTRALIRTLNEDDNINVRLAALEALKPYATNSGVREALIRSIAKQQSPLVQVSLAELMVALQERAAVKEFERILDAEATPTEVKRKLRESIEILI